MIRRRAAVAVYQFNGVSKNRDVSDYASPPARFFGVDYSGGPDNNPKGSLYFRGTRNSYVLIPHIGCLDTIYSITILFWLYPKSTGPLVHFNPNGRGVDVQIESPFKLSARFLPRSGKSVRPVTKRIPPNKWSYLAVTYNYKTGLATLWKFSIPIFQLSIGRFRRGLETSYPIVIGRKPGDRRSFQGKISCLQIYNYAMTGVQIRSKMTRCHNPGVYRVPGRTLFYIRRGSFAKMFR